MKLIKDTPHFFHNMRVPIHLLTVFTLFGIGGAVLATGIVMKNSALMYGSGGFSSAGILLSVYLCFKDRRPPTVFENPAFAPRLYKEPGMKKNKSDTNLELMGAAKNTTDDGDVERIV